jgi:hypothetical protein
MTAQRGTSFLAAARWLIAAFARPCVKPKTVRPDNISAPVFRADRLPELDPGIRRAVKILTDHGVETFESCEGGPGHAYPEPTIRFCGGPGAGFRALSVCLDFGLRVSELRRVWDVLDRNDPTGPYWEVTFRERPC